MCCASSDEMLPEADVLPSFEEIQTTVTAYFDVTEGYLQHGVPTFHVNYKDNSKEAFLKLMKRLESMKLLPVLRENNKVYVLQILAKPPTQPNRNTINIALFFATLGTVLFQVTFKQQTSLERCCLLLP